MAKGQRRACPVSSGSRPPACRARGGERQRRGGRDPHAVANGRRHNLLRFWPSVLPYLRDDAFSSGDVVLTSMEWLTPGDVGFLPSLHLLTIEPGDIERLFIPHHLAARCQLYEGCSIELVDYLDRQFTVHVSKATYSHYLAEGWSEFLSAVGAKCCDFMLIEFKNTRQCKVAVFGRYGVQKYPPLEAEHVQKLLHPRNSDHSWPEVYSPETAIKVGPCTKPSPPATIGEQSPPSALSCN